MSKGMLLARLAEDPQFPTPPGIALRILEQASCPDCRLDDLTTLLQTDPGMCAKLLKTANSVLFSLPRAVSSIGQAVRLLGTRTVRSLVLCHALPALRPPAIGKQLLCDFWKASVAGGVLARELARKLGRPDPEEDLLAGLLRDLGILTLYHVQPNEYTQVVALCTGLPPSQHCAVEEDLLGLNHAEVSAFLLERWRLPEEITQPIRYHHHPNQAVAVSPVVAERAALLYFATQTAQLLLTPLQAETHREVLDLAQASFAMNRQQFAEFLEPLSRQIEELAGLLQVDIGTCDQYAHILVTASDELMQLTVEANQENQRLREEKTQAEQEARWWRQTASRLQQEVVRDPLTRAYNRAFLEEDLATEWKRACRRRTLLGLLFIDLDEFKLLNDRFGHLAGDQALQEVVTTLHKQVRAEDLVARYGGDEFCLLVADTSEDGLRCLAERIHQALNEVQIERERQQTRLQASVGAALCAPYQSRLTAAQFLASGDEAMYTAKRLGKNQVTLVSLIARADDRLLA